MQLSTEGIHTRWITSGSSSATSLPSLQLNTSALPDRMPIPIPIPIRTHTAIRMSSNHGTSRITILLVAILRQIRQAELAGLFFIVGPDQPVPVGAVVPSAAAVFHTDAGLDTRDHVGADGVAAMSPGNLGAVWIVAGEVEEVDACEGHKEAAEQGDGVDYLGRAEAPEEDK